MQPRLGLPVVLLALMGSCWGQSLIEARERIASGWGVLDDVEIVPSGPSPYLVSLPLQQVVGFIDAGQLTPLVSGTVHGMALDPMGTSVWTGDFLTGVLNRVDLGSGAITASISGFDHPLEILFLTPDTFLVGSLLGTSFFTSPGIVRRVTLPAGGGPPQIQTITTNVVGGMDLVTNAQGRLFMVSLGSQNLDEVDASTGIVSPVAGPVTQGTDLMPGPGNTVYVSTALAGEILQIDPSQPTPTIFQLAALLGEAPGPGCEDMAFDPQGRLVVTLNNGELWRLPTSGELQQIGVAFSTLPFGIALDLPAHPLMAYQLGASFGVGPGLPITGISESLLILPDALLFASLAGGAPTFHGFSGQLDASGRAIAASLTPNLAPFTTLDVYLQGIAWDPNTVTVLDVSDALHIRLFN